MVGSNISNSFLIGLPYDKEKQPELGTRPTFMTRPLRYFAYDFIKELGNFENPQDLL